MEFVPWRNVADWHCRGCRYCCKLYSVVLHYPEYLAVTKTYGQQATVTEFRRFFIRRHSDGDACAFLCNSNRNCALQNMKPDACKIWSFKVLAEPKYGEAKHAEYHLGDQPFYIYVINRFTFTWIPCAVAYVTASQHGNLKTAPLKNSHNSHLDCEMCSAKPCDPRRRTILGAGDFFIKMLGSFGNLFRCARKLYTTQHLGLRNLYG